MGKGRISELQLTETQMKVFAAAFISTRPDGTMDRERFIDLAGYLNWHSGGTSLAHLKRSVKARMTETGLVPFGKIEDVGGDESSKTDMRETRIAGASMGTDNGEDAKNTKRKAQSARSKASKIKTAKSYGNGSKVAIRETRKEEEASGKESRGGAVVKLDPDEEWVGDDGLV